MSLCPCVLVSLCPSVQWSSVAVKHRYCRVRWKALAAGPGESILVSDLILYIVIARTRSTFHVPWPTTPVFALRFTLSLCPSDLQASVLSLQTSSKHHRTSRQNPHPGSWDTWELAAAPAVRAIFRTYCNLAQGARGGRDADAIVLIASFGWPDACWLCTTIHSSYIAANYVLPWASSSLGAFDHG